MGCTGLKAEWRGTTTTQFPVVPGTVVEVSCTYSGALKKGSNKVTCTSGTEFTHSTEPSCSELGKFTDRYQIKPGITDTDVSKEEPVKFTNT